MTISAIAAVSNQWQIGLNEELPWARHSENMAWLRKITAGKGMLAGHNTFEILKHMDFDLDRGLIKINSFTSNERADFYFKETRSLFDGIIIGGAKTYATTARHIDQLYLSRKDYNGAADTFFPVDAFSPEQIQNAIWR